MWLSSLYVFNLTDVGDGGFPGVVGQLGLGQLTSLQLAFSSFLPHSFHGICSSCLPLTYGSPRWVLLILILNKLKWYNFWQRERDRSESVRGSKISPVIKFRCHVKKKYPHCKGIDDSFSGMNIPMYGAVKRCTPLVNLVLATLILRRPPPSLTLTTSILTITAGCFVAGMSVCCLDCISVLFLYYFSN